MVANLKFPINLQEFTLVRQWKEQLRVMSDTIKYVDYNDAES